MAKSFETEKEVPESDASRNRIVGALRGWRTDSANRAYLTDARPDDHHSSVIEVHFGKNLVAEITRDRGCDVVLVGTSNPNDLYPIEDVAIACGWLDASSVHERIDMDFGADYDPPIRLEDAIDRLQENAKALDENFAPENREFRTRLRKVAEEFRLEWERRIAQRKPY